MFHQFCHRTQCFNYLINCVFSFPDNQCRMMSNIKNVNDTPIATISTTHDIQLFMPIFSQN